MSSLWPAGSKQVRNGWLIAGLIIIITSSLRAAGEAIPRRREIESHACPVKFEEYFTGPLLEQKKNKKTELPLNRNNGWRSCRVARIPIRALKQHLHHYIITANKTFNHVVSSLWPAGSKQVRNGWLIAGLIIIITSSLRAAGEAIPCRREVESHACPVKFEEYFTGPLLEQKKNKKDGIAIDSE